MRKVTKRILLMTTCLAVMLLSNAVDGQTIWGAVDSELANQRSNMLPLITNIVGWAAVASLLLLGGLFLFGSRENSQKARYWAGGFVIGLALMYVALSLW